MLKGPAGATGRAVVFRLLAIAALVIAAVPARSAGPLVDPLRGPAPIVEEAMPPRLGNAINDDQRVRRNHPDQPPVVPHRVDGYQVDRNFNKCLDCHARERTELSKAIPVSRTHYVDRAGKVLDRVSTRRYFCQQCHVAQDAVAPMVGNTFRGPPGDAATAAPRPRGE